MKNIGLLEKIERNGKKLLLICCALLAFTFTWGQVSFNLNTIANAATLDRLPHLLATDTNPIREFFGAGTGDKVEGKVQEDIGTVERNVGKVTGQTEGALDQAQGKAKQSAGEAQTRLDRAGADLQRASENVINAVKDVTGQQ